LDKKHLIIAGLRRSGTTIVWETLRQDKRFLCFDEPFNKQAYIAANKGINNEKKSFDEFIKYSDVIKNYFRQIPLHEEINSFLKADQVNYLQKLLKLNNNICFDTTRCLLKIDELKKNFPNAFIVLLIRDVKAWVTSQLRLDTDDILGYTGDFNYWGYNQIANNLKIKKKYAYQSLIKVYKFYVEKMLESNADMILFFEQFCEEPEGCLRLIYTGLNLDFPKLDYSKIHKANGAYKESDKRWLNGASDIL